MFISAEEVGIFVAPYEKKLITTLLSSYNSETDSLSYFVGLWYTIDNQYKNQNNYPNRQPKKDLPCKGHQPNPKQNCVKRSPYRKNLIKPGIRTKMSRSDPSYYMLYKRLLREKKYATQAPL